MREPREPVTGAENIRRGFRARALPTHCANGHEYTPENTRVTKRQRKCRACCRAEARRAYQRSKLAALQGEAVSATRERSA